jgi:hypothetical protein
MRLKASAKLFLKKPKGDPRYREDDPGFTDDELKRVTEVTGIKRTVIADFAKYEAVILNHYYDDTITQKLISLLENEMGRTIRYSEIVQGKDALAISLNKEFEAEDINNAKYFNLYAPSEIGIIDTRKYWQDEDGIPFIKNSVKNKIGGLNGGGGFRYRVFCNQDVKADMESMNFVGVDFVECELVGSSKNDIKLFELSSKIVLPRTSNSFTGGKKLPVREYGDEGTCLIAEKSSPRQLIYEEKVLAAMPLFDVAITCEKFGTDVPGKNPSRYRFPMLVVSPKFREWCLKRKYSKLEFYPIKEVS